MTGPRVTESEVLFEFADPDHILESVAVYQEVRRPRSGLPMARVEGGWALRLPRPGVDRLEYLLVLRGKSGHTEWIPDPANPRRADGPFGPKSVLELPGYAPPAWALEGAPPSGRPSPMRVHSTALGRAIDIEVWTSAGSDHGDELPLLVVNDGPEYARYSGLLGFLSRRVHDRLLPPLHVALLQPNCRTEEYSANPDYARALHDELLPAVEATVRVPAARRARVCMGTSLGGLAMMHAHRLDPGLCGGLFLQSASFFRRPIDESEDWFAGFARLIRFVDELVAAADRVVDAAPIVLTCGAVEENLTGNRAVRDALTMQGYPVRLAEPRDAHNWTAWRDALEPHLLDLLREQWG